VIAEEVLARGPAPGPNTGGNLGGASSSIPPPAPKEMEVIFGRQLRSGAELDVALIPLPRVLSRAHQVLNETEAAIRREWEALESEHQRLSDWRTQLEERTKVASCQFASERSKLTQDRKEYKRDLQKVFARELEASRWEKKLAKREEALSQREALTTELRAKLNALDQTLEAQRVQQVEAIERMKKWQQELEDKASDIALAEANLEEKDTSLDRRETDLARWEKDLAFREEMLERQGMLLAEHELEAEEKERKLEERIRQFEAAQAAPGLQATEATKKALEDLQAEHRAGVQRIAEWAGEASTTLVPLEISPILMSEPLASISDALPVLDSAAERLRRLDQILGARLEAEGSRLYRAVVDYVLTSFRSHDPAMSLAPVLDGPVAATEDATRESVQDAMETVAARFQRDPADPE
jgi:chromosome segregation ATPase